MKKYSLLYVLTTVVLMNCAVSKKTTSGTSNTEAGSESSSYHNLGPEKQLEAVSNLTSEQYSHGWAIYQAKCASCHELPAPDSHDLSSWLRIMNSMAEKAKLSADEEKEVMGFLTKNCCPKD